MHCIDEMKISMSERIFACARRKGVLMLVAALTACLEPYNPPEIKEDVDILVVDGFINTTDSSSQVHLSKAVPLSYNEEPRAVSNALVQVEEENGPSYTLQELESGSYSLTKMNLNPAKRYRLSVLTNNDAKYFSDFIDLVPTPQIDSVTWHPSQQQPGIDIFVNTHDDSGRSKYYRWTFEETWVYRSNYGAMYKIVSGQVEPNPLDISTCYHSKPSTEIHLGSTVQLSTEVIRNFPLVFIPVLSQKVSVKYSILVKQQSLTKEAYNFWTQLKKSTESLGGLFDPMPSQVLGNIHSENNSAEPVLGYFSGGQTSEKRIFIKFGDLPPDLMLVRPYNCPIDTIEVEFIKNNPNMFLITSYGSPFVLGYVKSQGSNCMDCRDDGGVLTRPDFWE